MEVKGFIHIEIGNFLIAYHQNLEPESFEQKGKRTFLKSEEKLKIILAVTKLFNRRIRHTRIKNFGTKAKIKNVIKEEPIELAQYLRDNNARYDPFPTFHDPVDGFKRQGSEQNHDPKLL